MSIKHSVGFEKIAITIVSVWVGQISNDIENFNHMKYARRLGYNFTFFYKSQEQWHKENGGLSPGWSKVMFLRQLLKESHNVDYFMYLDMDAIFVRDDLRIEDTIGHINSSISLFTQEVYPNNCMPQSHAFILKNNAFSVEFVDRWWQLRTICPHVAMEQGAFFQSIGESFAILSEFASTPFTCINRCNSTNPIAYHHCFDNWMKVNGFGPGVNIHPKIHIFGFIDEHWVASDGFSTHLRSHEVGGQQTIKGVPLTVHPCKDVRFLYHDPSVLPLRC